MLYVHLVTQYFSNQVKEIPPITYKFHCESIKFMYATDHFILKVRFQESRP